MECLWYDGEKNGCYHLLNFNPKGLNNKQIKEKAVEELKNLGFSTERDIEKALETLYLLNVDDLIKRDWGGY